MLPHMSIYNVSGFQKPIKIASFPPISEVFTSALSVVLIVENYNIV
jgi:hypothetical protein